MGEIKTLSLLKELENLEALKKDIEKQIETVKSQILPDLENIETIDTDLYLIRYTLCERVSLDSKKIEKELPDIYKAYKKATLYRRFSYQLK